MTLLTVSTPTRALDGKTYKGIKLGYLTGILYLAPGNQSGINTCANASPGCLAGCLDNAGRAAIFPAIHKARIRKTLELFADRKAFINRLEREIQALVRKANRLGLRPCIRINGTSDLPWLALAMADRFPDVQFYDYTKHPKPINRIRPNYSLTFSKSEINMADCLDALATGINVAVVFPVKKGHVLPQTWNGYPVIDGDVSDLRFNDPCAAVHPDTGKVQRGVIVGLRAKGSKAKHDTTGFVQIAASL